MSKRYESSMRGHEESAQRHEAAAALWDTHHEARAEIDGLTGEIKLRSARLQRDDAALEQERVRLWAHHDRWEHGRSARAAKARAGVTLS